MDRRRQQRCANSWMQLRCPELVKSSSAYLNRTVMTSTQTQSRPSSCPACATELSISIRNHLERQNSAKFQEYSALSTSTARQEWLAGYLLDPKTGRSVGRNWTQRALNIIDNERDGWLNSGEHAEIAITSLVSRSRLRSGRILQYQWASESHRQEQNPHARVFRRDLS